MKSTVGLVSLLFGLAAASPVAESQLRGTQEQTRHSSIDPFWAANEALYAKCKANLPENECVKELFHLQGSIGRLLWNCKSGDLSSGHTHRISRWYYPKNIFPQGPKCGKVERDEVKLAPEHYRPVCECALAKDKPPTSSIEDCGPAVTSSSTITSPSPVPFSDASETTTADPGRTSTTESASATATNAGQVPGKVKIHGVSLLGSGCPAGSADVQLDATGSLVEVTFSTYEVQSGPNTTPADWRKNCKLTLNMEFDPRYQFAILDTDMIGFAEIPDGVKGQCTNTFSYTGKAAEHVDYSIDLAGKHSGNFNLHSDPTLEHWSSCGSRTAILNMNTACHITPTHLPALIAVDHVSGKLTVKARIVWRVCN